jgi:hypothetical protein
MVPGSFCREQFSILRKRSDSICTRGAAQLARHSGSRGGWPAHRCNAADLQSFARKRREILVLHCVHPCLGRIIEPLLLARRRSSHEGRQLRRLVAHTAGAAGPAPPSKKLPIKHLSFLIISHGAQSAPTPRARLSRRAARARAARSPRWRARGVPAPRAPRSPRPRPRAPAPSRGTPPAPAPEGRWLKRQLLQHRAGGFGSGGRTSGVETPRARGGGAARGVTVARPAPSASVASAVPCSCMRSPPHRSTTAHSGSCSACT